MRFPEFDGEWEKYNVSDILNTFPTNSLSWDNLSYKCGKIKNIHYGLIHNGFDTTCVYTTNKIIPFIKDGNFPLEYTLLKTGDLILADASENRKDVGRPIEIINDICENIISGLHTIHARDESNIAVQGFKGFYFQSKSMKSQIYRIANGSKIYGISPSNFKELHMCLPDHLEQEKIVVLLRKIETRIQTQSKIINKCKSLINQIYDCLLWNFKDTKKIKLSDILIEKNEKSKINDQYPILSSTVKGLFLQSEYFDREIASSNNIGYKITNKRDIIISPQNLWMGNITYNDKYDNGLVSPSYKIYTINDKHNPTYISTLLKSYRALYMFKTVSEQGASVVRRNLNLDSFYEISFNIPSKKEQDKISKLINSFNIKISLEEKYLQDLQFQKKFLLDNMFI